jgi:Ca2+-transporting ATPase
MNEKKYGGLSSAEAAKRLAESGPNHIYRPEQMNFFAIARHEVTEPMILLLLVVGLLYSIWGKLGDSITIFLVIFLLVLAEVHNEYRAKKAIASLAGVAAPMAMAMRDGRIVKVDIEAVVPGDLLVLSQGTKIAADAMIVRATVLQVDESPLSGESFPRDKKNGDKVYAGTTVLSGEGKAEVLSTGGNTRLGEIASTLKTIRPPRTALQSAMKSLVGKLVFVAVFFSALIPAIGIIRGQDLKTMVLTGLSLSFATIPEELPIIITMVLGLGAYTLSKHNFLVKRLQGAETLGNATVIVADKTGTLTRGEMKISSVYPPGGENEVLGAAYRALPEFVLSPMESEIKKRAEEAGAGGELPGIFRQRSFGEEGKRTKAILRRDEDLYRLFVIGEPEEVLAGCGEVSEEIPKKLIEESTAGRRVIAVASGTLAPGQEDLDFAKIEKKLGHCGLISFEDPPRKGVKETILLSSKAGIRTIMVTGDHSLTAAFIANETGIPSETVLEGKDLDAMTEGELAEAVGRVSVFARTSPQHKYRIVSALQKNSEVVAVTGDGINDVLALKGADIGIAMGVRGTDVARDAADVVLADDDYVTIARGIFEGRKFFDNLQKGITYYLSVKVALIMIFLLPVLLGLPLPFSPIQIVILELFMDLAASAGFVAEPQERDIYSRPPRNPREEVLSPRVITDIIAKGFVLFLAVAGAYFYARYAGLGFRETQTFAFSAWIFGHIFLAVVSRSGREPVFSLGICTNTIIDLWAVGAVVFLLVSVNVPFVGERFNLSPIGLHQMFAIAAAALILISPLEIRKYLATS